MRSSRVVLRNRSLNFKLTLSVSTLVVEIPLKRGCMAPRLGVFIVMVAVFVAILVVSPVTAQSVLPLDKIQNQQELDQVGAALDTALFDAYNKCDLDKFSSFFVDDVEFYHDQGGVTSGKTALTDSLKKNICGKTTPSQAL